MRVITTAHAISLPIFLSFAAYGCSSRHTSYRHIPGAAIPTPPVDSSSVLSGDSVTPTSSPEFHQNVTCRGSHLCQSTPASDLVDLVTYLQTFPDNQTYYQGVNEPLACKSNLCASLSYVGSLNGSSIKHYASQILNQCQGSACGMYVPRTNLSNMTYAALDGLSIDVGSGDLGCVSPGCEVPAAIADKIDSV